MEGIIYTTEAELLEQSFDSLFETEELKSTDAS